MIFMQIGGINPLTTGKNWGDFHNHLCTLDPKNQIYGDNKTPTLLKA
jgi:hypothetical protein